MISDTGMIYNKLKDYIDTGIWKYETCPLNKRDLEIIISTLEDLQYYRELARTYAKTINKLTKIIEETQERTTKQ